MAVVLIGAAVVVLALLIGAFTALAPAAGARVGVILGVGLVLIFAALQRTKGEFPASRARAWVTVLLLVTVFWPTYITLRAEPLPSLDPRRLLGLGILCILAYELVSRAATRSRLGSLRGFSLLVFVWIILLMIQRWVSAFTAPYVAYALPLVFWEMASYSAVTVAAILLFRGDDIPEFVARLILQVGVVCGVLAVIEFTAQRNVVLDLLGRFGNADELTSTALSISRIRDGRLRAQGPFEHPLQLAEFGCVAFAFALALLLWRPERVRVGRALIWSSLVLSLSAVVLSFSRSGVLAALVVGTWIGVLKMLSPRAGARLTGFEASLRLGLVAALLLGTAAAVLPSALELARGSTRAESESSQARQIMMSKGMTAIEQSPITGSGIGTAVVAAGIKGTGGVPTLDNYFLLVAIDSGLLYLFLFVLLLVGPSVWAGQLLVSGEGRGAAFLAGASAALLSMVVMRSVLSINYNLPIAFLLIGLMTQLQPVKRVGAWVQR